MGYTDNTIQLAEHTTNQIIVGSMVVMSSVVAMVVAMVVAIAVISIFSRGGNDVGTGDNDLCTDDPCCSMEYCSGVLLLVQGSVAFWSPDDIIVLWLVLWLDDINAFWLDDITAFWLDDITAFWLDDITAFWLDDITVFWLDDITVF